MCTLKTIIDFISARYIFLKKNARGNILDKATIVYAIGFQNKSSCLTLMNDRRAVLHDLVAVCILSVDIKAISGILEVFYCFGLSESWFYC